MNDHLHYTCKILEETVFSLRLARHVQGTKGPIVNQQLNPADDSYKPPTCSSNGICVYSHVHT